MRFSVTKKKTASFLTNASEVLAVRDGEDTSQYHFCFHEASACELLVKATLTLNKVPSFLSLPSHEVYEKRLDIWTLG